MGTFLRTISKGILELLAALLFLAALVLFALAIFGSQETTGARIIYAVCGVIGAPLSLVMLAWANPKDTEGSLLFVLLSIIGWPK